MNFCTIFFIVPWAKRLVNAAPDEELERLVGNRQVEATLAEPVEFLGYGEPGDFALNPGKAA
jgi:hypothetical protein